MEAALDKWCHVPHNRTRGGFAPTYWAAGRYSPPARWSDTRPSSETPPETDSLHG
jgi:hypothetical protein